MVYSCVRKVLTMSSQRKIDAARRNGALGRGRKTTAGLARSARNAYRHGLLADIVLIEGEGLENFEELHRQFRDRFLPVDCVEDGLIEEMVSAWWRMRRAWDMEHNLMAAQMEGPHAAERDTRAAKAFAYLSLSPPLNLVHRYESRLQRNFQRSMDNLFRLRAETRREKAYAEAESTPPKQAHPVPPAQAETPQEESRNSLTNHDVTADSTPPHPAAPTPSDPPQKRSQTKLNPILGNAPKTPAEALFDPESALEPVTAPPKPPKVAVDASPREAL